MLDKTTKTKIDTARDILVGKVPNPQSQVELITIAMIYKFMDDMDMQNIELGGNRIFFTDDLEQYAWRKVLSPKLNNWERISLYAEALDKLQVAKQIPELFRKIFKGAFLPFRDGATLTLFLNEIDGFSYNNSENLGNAFEYLLSIMGSQGDAGQFRTPRHIIDFIVEVVNPSKTDTILDPACGTAGFLISAYKHIMEQAKETKKPLTPAQHQQLMQNIVGYDISPDMVKLASVNLFLHQFPEPKIYEYDTLSSEERWDDKFDVILANPPFMTPKGGIMPNSKFGVKANRAEVLFVDYMMEHLNLKGKAGFVVPEGIIFQSATAYKALRKMMVEDNYLYAVVSLPSGVFNPYSGVKTSVLFFDRELAKQTQDILFVRVDKDGYDLGAQRRPIKDNDLPEAIELLKLWQKSITSGTIDEKISKSQRITIVPKAKIAEDDEYNLSASRYQEAQDFSNCQYDMVKLGDICDIIAGQSPKGETYNTDKIGMPFYQGKTEFTEKYISAPTKYTSSPTKIANKNDILMSVRAPVGPVNIAIDQCCIGRGLAAIRCKERINTSFLFYILKSMENQIKGNGGAVFDSISRKDIENIEIPLPPMSVQEEIVKELDAYQAIIDGAQKVVDNWKPTFKINPDWKKVKLGYLYNIEYGVTVAIPDNLDDNGIKIISTAETTIDGYLDFSKIRKVTMLEKYKSHILQPDTLLFNWRNAPKHVGKTVLFNETDEKYICASFLLPMIKIDNSKIINPWGWLEINRLRREGYFMEHSRQAVNQTNFNGTLLAQTEIYLPSLEEQKSIVAQIEQEEQYVDACKKLMELNKQKITDKIKSIWNCDNE